MKGVAKTELFENTLLQIAVGGAFAVILIKLFLDFIDRRDTQRISEIKMRNEQKAADVQQLFDCITRYHDVAVNKSVDKKETDPGT